MAVCRACSGHFSLAELERDQEMEVPNLGRPPEGAWYRKISAGFEIGTTTRSASAFFFVPFTMIWWHATLGFIYGDQFVEGRFDLELSLFGLPFAALAVVSSCFALMAVCGQTRVRVEGDQGEVFTGIGSFGRRRRFLWSDIRQVRYEELISSKGGRSSCQIELVNETKTISITLPLGDRAQFLYRALKRLVRQGESARKPSATARCPKCALKIPNRDMNPATDIAICRGCEEWFSFAGLMGEKQTGARDRPDLPQGTWFRQNGSVTELGATTRSRWAVVAVPVALILSLVTVALLLSLVKSKGGSSALIHGLIGLVLLLFDAFLVPIAFMFACGHVRVRANGDSGELFSGVGPVGRRWRFHWSELRRIEYKIFPATAKSRQTSVIEITTGSGKKWVGALLSEQRKQFVYRRLRQLARERGVYL